MGNFDDRTDFAAIHVIMQRWDKLPAWIRSEALTRSAYHVLWYLCRLIVLNGYKNILEIGTFRGRTACFMGAACASFGGKVTTINIDKKEVAFATSLAGMLGVDNVAFMTGSSLDVLPKLEQPKWDLVFIDGKHSYTHTIGEYRLVSPHLNEPSSVVFDDAGAVHADGRTDGGVPRTVAELGAILIEPMGVAVMHRGDVKGKDILSGGGLEIREFLAVGL